jgi:hypothetical protein
MEQVGYMLFVPSSAILPTCILGLLRNPQERKKEQDPLPEFADSSGPLFYMYREMAEEEDNKMAERWQKDAEGIIIFVSPQLLSIPFTHQVKSCRLAYSLLQSPHCSP